MSDNINPSIQRNDLATIQGINERTIRYLENLSRAIADSTPLTGSGSPNGVVNANSSRQYIDLTANTQWINTAPAYGQKTGWVML